MEEEVVLVDWRVFLNGILDVVQLLTGRADAVVEGIVVFGCRRQRQRYLRADPCVGTVLPTPPQAPQ